MTVRQNITGAEALLLSLLEEGADTIFGYPGGAIIPIYDKLYGYSDRIRHILTRHEQGAVHAAQGFARATGRVGVCIATSGPGATNLITGIADAMADSTPLVCVTAQVAASMLGSDAFQEADIISMTIPITKWNFQITKAEEVPSAIARAFYIARSGRPGPVVIDFAKSAQVETIADFRYTPCNGLRSYHPVPQLSRDAIAEAARLINDSERPIMLVGQGVKIAGAEQALIRLAEKACIPMASTLMGLSAVPSSHPLYVGKLGMHGNIAPNDMTERSDLVIAVGMRFSDRVTGDVKRYAPLAKVVHIDIDSAEIGKNVRVDAGVLADAGEALEALLPLVEQKKRPEWLGYAKERYAHEYDIVIKHTLSPDKGYLSMGEVVNEVADRFGGDAVIVTDVGQQQMFASRYSRFNHSRSFITSGGLGTMGFGLPAAIGAKIGVPDKEVVLLVGDGGLQMTIQELGTIMQSDIPVKIVVLNNSFLGMVRQWQEIFYEKRYSFTELADPDFTTVAKAYRIDARRVDTYEGLKEAVKEMKESKKAYLLEVVVKKEENVFPMIPAGGSVTETLLSV